MLAMNTHVKVYFRHKIGVDRRVSYCSDLFNSPYGKYLCFSTFKSNVVGAFPELEKIDWKMYWIDYEGDEIEIREKASYAFFVAEMKGKQKKIYVDDRKSDAILYQGAETVFVPTLDRSSQKSDEMSDSKEKHHQGVVCNGCNASIVGFRYKCVQCPHFDLCGKCEGKMLHNEHVMFRIPIPLDRQHWHCRHNYITNLYATENGSSQSPFQPGK